MRSILCSKEVIVEVASVSWAFISSYPYLLRLRSITFRMVSFHYISVKACIGNYFTYLLQSKILQLVELAMDVTLMDVHLFLIVH